MSWPTDLNFQTAAMSIALNLGKRFRLLRKVRGGHETLKGGIIYATKEARWRFASIRQYLGDLAGKDGLEIGPGDNLGVAYCCLAAGAHSLVAVEKLDTVSCPTELRSAIFARMRVPEPDQFAVSHKTVAIEDYDGPPVDFVYSIDVLEHVIDVPAVARAVARLLRPGGIAVHSVDLAGHNTFPNAGISHLTCPEWLYQLMHSHLVTSNRVRLGDLLQATKEAGLVVDACVPVRSLPLESVEQLRPQLQKRWRDLPADDLAVLQVVLRSRKQMN